MLTIDQALQKILAASTTVTEVETVTLSQALGRTLAEPQQAAINVPPADNSAMDGYALNIDDLNTGNTLPICQVIAAGDTPQPLTAHSCARIFTGAEIPPGANAVVMQENCQHAQQQDQDQAHITITITQSSVSEGENIRRCGQDIPSGATLFNKGHRLQPQDIGLLAAIGVAELPVYRPLTVAILSTGNELATPGKPLKPGEIYNSNSYLLQSLLQAMGIRILDLGTSQDNLAATQQLLHRASAADCIISSGGVSLGEQDYIKQAITELGVLTLWKIAIKPGKPMAFGQINHTPFFGLPGNPVSTLITFLFLVKPFLVQQQGQTYSPPRRYRYRANFARPANPQRLEYLRVNIDGDTLTPYPNQSSGVLSSVVYSDGLAVIPQGVSIAPGDSLEVLPFELLM